MPNVTATILTTEEAAAPIDELYPADAILFGAPASMRSMSVGMETLLEVAAKKGFTLAWKDRVERQGRRRVHELQQLRRRQAQHADQADDHRDATQGMIHVGA